ncbi:MAG: hypothetical protein ACXVXM_16560 [Nocardioidaceae bacterium]
MSKERARRREAREREAAIRAAARAAEAERRERQEARKRALRKRLPRARGGRPTGTLARRRRVQTSLVLATLVAVNVLAWFLRPDWAARLGVLVVSLLAAPVLVAVLVPRRR